MSSKYEALTYRLGSLPEEDLMTKDNLASWRKIREAFKGELFQTYWQLKQATEGHIHGDKAHAGRDSGAFVRYCDRRKWIKSVG